MSKFDVVYNQIISECTSGDVIVEGFSIREALGKVKDAFVRFKNGFKRKAEDALEDPVVQKAAEKVNLSKKSEQLFDKMFKASIKGDALVVEVVSKEDALKEIKSTFKRDKAENSTIQEDYSHRHALPIDDTSTAEKVGFFSYAGTALAGLTWLNYFFPWFWCISLFMIAAPILAHKIIEWKKAKVLHYRIYRNGSLLLDTEDFDEFSSQLEVIADDNCEFCAQTYKFSNASGTRVIDSMVSNARREFKDLGKVDRAS